MTINELSKNVINKKDMYFSVKSINLTVGSIEYNEVIQ